MADPSAPRLACPSCHGLGLKLEYTRKGDDDKEFVCRRCLTTHTFAEWKAETREMWLAFAATVRELEEEARG